jgi:hypothetical protein
VLAGSVGSIGASSARSERVKWTCLEKSTRERTGFNRRAGAREVGLTRSFGLAQLLAWLDGLGDGLMDPSPQVIYRV